MKRHTVVIADDHKVVAEALRGMLEPAYEVLDVVQDGRALVAAASQLRPDVILADIGMPLLNGLEAAKQIKQKLPKIKIILLTMQTSSRLVVTAFQSGVSAYVLKSAAAKELLRAIDDALRGGTYISQEFGISLPDLLLAHTGRPSNHDLTPRQIEVIQLLAEGRAMKEVAHILHISVRTVADHKYRIMAQLGLKTNADLFQYAAKRGIVSI